MKKSGFISAHFVVAGADKLLCINLRTDKEVFYPVKVLTVCFHDSMGRYSF